MRTLTVEREVTVPKNTSRSTPIRLEIPVGEGLVTETRVTFPPGPAGYVGVRLRVGGVQIVPQRLTEWLVGDDITFRYSVPVNLFASAGRIVCEAYNEDVMYDHTIILTFELLHQEKTPEEILAEIAQEHWDEKLSALKATLEQVLAAVVELKGTMEKVIAEALARYSRAQEEERLRTLKVAPLEELIRI